MKFNFEEYGLQYLGVGFADWEDAWEINNTVSPSFFENLKEFNVLQRNYGELYIYPPKKLLIVIHNIVEFNSELQFKVTGIPLEIVRKIVVFQEGGETNEQS